MKSEFYAQAEKLSAQIVEQSRSALCSHMPALSGAIYAMQPERDKNVLSFATDGMKFYYNIFYLLKRFQAGENEVARDYMHALLHNIFRHFSVTPTLERETWDLSCDIAAEYLLGTLGSETLESARATLDQSSYLLQLSSAIPSMSAEKLYRYLRRGAISRGELERMREVFCRDDHALWYCTEGKHHLQKKETMAQTRTAQILLEKENVQKLEEKWAYLSKRTVKILSETTNAEYKPLKKALTFAQGEQENYISFLRRFAQTQETTAIDLDSFDYIYYTYGLSLYGNMPLIEPLEYQENQQARHFAIAIDTSGSVSDELVERFLRSTCAILRAATGETGAHAVFYVMQCDAKLRETAILHSEVETEQYLEQFTVKGRGETDFRPVFAQLDTLLKKEKVQHLCGLLYFTDGDGTYPEAAPLYETAFILPENSPFFRRVPSWSLRVRLSEDALQEEPSSARS